MERCDMCLERFDKLTHLPLYVFGSEGVNLCHNCEMQLYEYIRQQAISAFRRKRDLAIERRKS